MHAASLCLVFSIPHAASAVGETARIHLRQHASKGPAVSLANVECCLDVRCW